MVKNARTERLFPRNDCLDGLQYSADPVRGWSAFRWSINVVRIKAAETGSHRNHSILILPFAPGNLCGSYFSGLVRSIGVRDLIPEGNRSGGERIRDCYSIGANYRKLLDDQPRHYWRVSGSNL